MKMISLLCPTRARTTLFKRMCESIIATTTDLSAVEVIAYIDEDDLESQQMQIEGLRVEKIIKPKAPMSICNHACLEKARGDIIMLMNDDVVIRTKHWDVMLREAANQFPDEIYLMNPNDLFKKQKLCTFPVLSRKTCEILVEPFTKQYHGNFIDTHLVDIFQRLRKKGYDRVRYLENIIFEHMHYRVGKGSFDVIYQARKRFGDDVHFVDLSLQREIAAERLIESIEGRRLSPFPLQYQNAPITNFANAFKRYFAIFAINKKLPLKWRLWLFTHFLARYWAGKLYN